MAEGQWWDAVLDAARADAERQGIIVSIAVVDDGGYLLALVRLQGAHKLTPQMAIDKAYTSAIYRRPSSELAQMPGELLAAARAAGLYPVLALPGAVPVRDGEALLGAVGVAGASPEQDESCAKAGAAAA